MPHIPLEAHLPGITGLLEYRQDTAAPIRNLTQILLRGESTLTQAERELIATVVSHANQCQFCTAAHTATVNALLSETTTVERVKNDPSQAPITEKMKALLEIAQRTQESGKKVSFEVIAKAKAVSATDLEIHDTVLIAALFCLYNKYVDGLASATPNDPAFYDQLANRLVHHGYERLPQGYDHLSH